MDLSAIRILEIGDHHLFKQILLRQTKLLWTGRRRPKLSASCDYEDCTPRAFLRAMREAAAGEFHIIVAYAGQRPPWHPRYWLRALFGDSPLTGSLRGFGVSWLRHARTRPPLVVLDMHDISTIDRSNFFLLDRARIYFKRELPVDHWQSLCGTAHANLPTSRIRGDPLWQHRIAKLHPISLQAGPIRLERGDAEVFAAKSADIFFAGAVAANSTVRSNGVAQLRKLADRGVKVDFADERLSRAAYHQRLSQAWLAWSPSGLGWDCYRHYEAPQCLAVPVMNYPTIARDRPLQDGVHAFYYAPDEDGLSSAVVAALADKEKLAAMALAARAHVRANHVDGAFCTRVLELALQDERHDELNALVPGKADAAR
jgi:hypothetical protein